MIFIADKDETKTGSEPEIFKMTNSNSVRVTQSEDSDSKTDDSSHYDDSSLEYYEELQNFLDVFELFDQYEQFQQ